MWYVSLLSNITTLHQWSSGFTPHGVSYEEFEAASNENLTPKRISEGSVAFMFESSRILTITNYAMQSHKKHEHDTSMWDPLQAQFLNHTDEVNEALASV